MNDLKFAFRQLFKHPGYSAIAILTFALGIGATTAIFSVVNAVLLRPLDYPDSSRLITLRESFPPKFPDYAVSPAAYMAWVGEVDALAGVSLQGGGAFTYLPQRGDPVRVVGASVTPNWFEVLGVPAARGRALRAWDARPDQQGSGIVISHGFWQRQLGGDENVVGRVVTIDSIGRTVLGVMPAGFERDGRAEIWVPFETEAAEAWKESGFGHWLQATGRLKPGATMEQLQAQLATVDERLAREHPAERGGWHSIAYGKLEFLTKNARGDLRTMFLACGLLLVLACTNAAALTLVRTITRAHELSVRAALGASAGRLARLVVVESVALAMLGAAFGLLLAAGLSQVLQTLEPDQFPRAFAVNIDARVLGFAIAAALVSGLVAGALPALAAARLQLEGGLRAAAAGVGAGVAHSRVRLALVAGQIALATVLLGSAGLLLRSFAALRAVDPGFDAHNAVTVSVAPPFSIYSTKEKQEAFVRQLTTKLESLPGATAAGMAQILPIDGDWGENIVIEGRAAAAAQEKIPINFYLVSPGWFPALAIPLRSGRLLTAADADGPPVCVVSESLVRKYFPGENPLGRRVAMETAKGVPEFREIVGVVGEIKVYGLDRVSLPQYYLPLKASPSGSVSIVARGAAGPAALTSAMRKAVLAVDPTLPTSRGRTLEEIIDGSVERRRISLQIIAAFALSALIIATLGVYGAVAYNVAVRTREYGIRLALGAAPTELRRHVLASGLKLAAVGLALGLPAALLASRAVRAQLFGVEPFDPITLVVITIGLLAAALLASWRPARRAAKIDPVVALRSE